jgi:hypothetical protein
MSSSTSPGKRAGQQFLESSGIVVVLILILEWITPWMAQRKTDSAEFAFALIFGALIVITHVTMAYLRPLNKLELKAMVEDVMRADAMERTHPELPRVRQMAEWSANDPTWLPTKIEVPAVRPPQPSPNR